MLLGQLAVEARRTFCAVFGLYEGGLAVVDIGEERDKTLNRWVGQVNMWAIRSQLDTGTEPDRAVSEVGNHHHHDRRRRRRRRSH